MDRICMSILRPSILWLNDGDVHIFLDGEPVVVKLRNGNSYGGMVQYVREGSFLLMSNIDVLGQGTIIETKDVVGMEIVSFSEIKNRRSSEPLGIRS